MRLEVPASALAPMLDTRITVRAPSGRNDVADPWEFEASVVETDPYAAGQSAGSGAQSTTWQVAILAADLDGRRIPPGATVDPVPGRHIPRLYVERVSYNGSAVHLQCSARERAV